MNSKEPVSVEDLTRLRLLQESREQIANRVLVVEEEKIRLMASAKRVGDEWNGLLARIASERGIDSNSQFEINPKTGEVLVPSAEGSTADAQPEAVAVPEAEEAKTAPEAVAKPDKAQEASS